MYIAITEPFHKGTARTEYRAIGCWYRYSGLKQTNVFHIKPDLDAVQNGVKGNTIERLSEKENAMRQSLFQPQDNTTFVTHRRVRGWIGRLSENQISVIEQPTDSLPFRLEYERLFMLRLG